MFRSFKMVYFSTALALIGLANFAIASETAADDQSEKTVTKSSWTNEQGELVISTGPRKDYSSSHITKSENSFFCNSNTVNVLVERRLDESSDETFKTFDISAKFNGDTIDIFSGKGLPSALENFFHIGVDMTCSDEEIGLFLTGYNDSSTESGTTLVAVKINSHTGTIK